MGVRGVRGEVEGYGETGRANRWGVVGRFRKHLVSVVKSLLGVDKVSIILSLGRSHHSLTPPQPLPLPPSPSPPCIVCVSGVLD